MATRRLVLLRHAKSDWHSGARSDFDRPLNARGRRDAPRVGRWLQANAELPERILCSSAARTRETLDGVFEGAGWSEAETDVNYRDNLYLASERTIVESALEALDEASPVMVVGHNPGMDLALIHFCPEVRADPRGKLMTTCALALIDVDEDRQARLVTFRRPAELDWSTSRTAGRPPAGEIRPSAPPDAGRDPGAVG